MSQSPTSEFMTLVINLAASSCVNLQGYFFGINEFIGNCYELYVEVKEHPNAIEGYIHGSVLSSL